VLEIRRYLTGSGKDVFGAWMSGLRGRSDQSQIVARIDRLSLGNFGDCKALGSGLFELRIDWGPGYRVYDAMAGRACVLLLCGGDKRKQVSDIRRALEYLEDYRERTL
jgi:putative addiction module killer protein